jgi:hypothetical protein
MKRFLSVAVLLLACLPVGVSISGCGYEVSNFCDATDTKRISEVDVITLQPEFTPLSLQYMQTRLVATPSAKNCLGASVGVPKFSWASSNPLLVDISPTGNLCAGTWNRNTGGGIADYTICSSPTQQEINTLLAASGGTYSGFDAQITASANGITSNPITVYAHPQVTSAVGYTVPGSAGTGPAACTNPYGLTCSTQTTSSISPGQCYSASAATPITYCAVVCADGADITAAAGQVTFAAGTSGIVNINTDGVAEPAFPGATLITASVSGVTAAAGIYSTCAPASMALALPSSTASVISVPVGQKAQLELNVLDSTNAPITLSGLTYTSTNPRTLSIINGSVDPTFGGSGDVYAACLPPACNPSPIDDIGLFATTTASAASAVSGGNGVPLISNPITVVTPGTETQIGYVANFDTVDYPNANFIGVFNSQSNTVQATGTNYRPNSMVLSQNYATLYVGSREALMTFPASNTLGNEADVSQVWGRVVSISPTGATLILSGCTGVQHDCATGDPVIFLYSPANGSYTSYSGTAYRASWSADATTAYIAGGDHEYVYSVFTGWSVYPATASETDVEDVQVLAPPVGAFFSGDNTDARNYCSQPGAANPLQAGTGIPTERLGISTDGFHLFGATSAGSFDDFCIGIPTVAGLTTTGACQAAPVSPIAACSPTFAITATPTPSTVPIPTGSFVTGIPVATQSITTGNSTTTAYTAFVTYSNCVNTEAVNESCTNPAAGGGVLPYYAINGTGAATPGTLTLTDAGSAVAPIAPTAGAISSDGTTAYIATSGDNALHTLAINSATGVPVENVAPVPLNLPAGIQGQNVYIPADKILVRPNRAN